MSMLTPRGEDVGRPRRRRSYRAAITLTLALALLVGAGWYGYRLAMGEDDGRTTGKPTTRCTPATGGGSGRTAVAAPSDVAVNVYNATARQGLARSVAEQLRSRRFRVRQVANDSTERRVRGVGEVRHGKDGAAAARTLRAHLPGVVDVVDRRRGSTVDLALGPKYQRLAAPKTAKAALRKVAAGKPAKGKPAASPTAC
ncbi:MAG: LytR C-terminal domain-containing protein [Actinomycetota bacterium]|nr:LytR C-terminal domain-containing protein [Actinomycetota bacterium]